MSASAPRHSFFESAKTDRGPNRNNYPKNLKPSGKHASAVCEYMLLLLVTNGRQCQLQHFLDKLTNAATY
jgi:hypothetical protein